MKKILFFFLTCCTALAQETALPVSLLTKDKAGPELFAGTDAFGWEYTIYNNELRKEKDGKTAKYKALQLGDIYKVDLQNPLQVVLFYKNFNAVVLLDSQLNETARIQFSNIPNPIVAEAIGLASQNRLWVYDINSQQIGLFDLAQQTFRSLTPPLNDGLTFYQSDYNYFYWADAKNNFYQLNLFGKVNAIATLPAFDSAQLVPGNRLLMKAESNLYLYNLETQRLNKIAIVEKSFNSFYYKAQILSIFTESEIIQYKITLPK